LQEELSSYQTAYHFGSLGPQPPPSWVITAGDAVDRQLGVLKTGKEADVFLVERSFGEDVNLLAAKRYRDAHHRSFRNDAAYRAARKTGVRRVDLAMAKGTGFGNRARLDQWVQAEMETLGRLWSAGVNVPYPVQLLEHELMLEFIGDDGVGAPRLAQAGVDRALAADLFAALMDDVRKMARCGIAHGDLSAFNVLVHRGRPVVIDFPQAVDILGHPSGMELLHRDVVNLCTWFGKRGVASDAEDLFSDVLSYAFA
jgi:RIO kinase 1